MNCKEKDEIKKKIRFDLLSTSLGTDAANEVVNQYNFGKDTVPFEHTFNGEKSKLFEDLTKEYGIVNAIQISTEIRTKQFLDEWGNWMHNKGELVLNKQGEPKINEIKEVLFEDRKAGETKEEREKRKRLATDLERSKSYKIGDANEKEIQDMVDTGVTLANKLIKQGTLNKAQLYNSLLYSFQEKQDFFLKRVNDKSSEISDLVKGKIDRYTALLGYINSKEYRNTYFKLVDKELEDLGYSTINKEGSTDYKDKINEDGMFKEIWDNEKKWQIPIDNTLQFFIKSYLNSIRVPKLINGKSTGKYEFNSVGYIKTYKGKDVILKMLSHFKNDKVTGDNIIEKLNKSGVPEFVELAKKLETGNPIKTNKWRIINSLVTRLGSAENSKIILANSKEGYKAIKINNYINRKYITNKWLANQSRLALRNKIFDTDEKGRIFLGDKGLKTLNNISRTIKSIIETDDYNIIETHSIKDKLNEVINSKEFNKADNEKKNNLINKIFYTKRGTTIDSQKLPLGSFTRGVFKKLLLVDKDGAIKLKHFDTERLNSELSSIELEKGSNKIATSELKINTVAPIIKRLFNYIGMDLKEDTIKKFLNNPSKYMSDLVDPSIKVELRDLVKTGKAFKGINVLHTIISDIGEGNKSSSKSKLKNNNPLDTSAVKKVFSKLKEMEEVNSIESTFTNGEGNKESSFVYSSALNDIIKNLNREDVSKYQADPFSKDNYLFKRDQDGNIISIESFKLHYFDNLKNENTGRTSKMTKMSPREKEITRLNDFINNESGFNEDKYSIISPLVFSDKSRSVLVEIKRDRLPRDFMVTLENNRIKATSTNSISFHRLEKGVMSELNRIHNLIQRDKDDTLDNLDDNYKENGKQFIIFPGLNHDKFYSKYISEKGVDFNNPQLRHDIKRYVANVMIKEANTLLGNWKDNNILYTSNGKSKMRNIEERIFNNKDYHINNKFSPEKLALNIVGNELSTNLSLIQLLGDPAFFYSKGNNYMEASMLTFGNYYKRLGSYLGMKMTPNYSFETSFNNTIKKANYNTTKYLFSRDVKTDRYSTEYIKRFNSSLGTSVVTDGVEVTTLLDHIVNLFSMGRIDSDIFNSVHNKIIKSYKKGTNVYLSDNEKLVVIPQKPLTVSLDVHKTGILVPTIIKSSSIPLLADITEGSPMNDIRLKLESIEKEGIFNENNDLRNTDNYSTARLAFEGAIKSKSYKYGKLINDDFSINKKALDEAVPIEINKYNLGIQQEESINKEYTVNTISQMDKIIHSGTLKLSGFKLPKEDKEYTGKELLNLKRDIKNDIYNIKLKKLYKQYGVTSDSVNKEKLFKQIINKAKLNNISLANLRLLELSNGEFKMPLYFNSAFRPIVSSLLSEVSKGVLRYRVSGTGAVQVSNIGMLFKDSSTKNKMIFTDEFKDKLDYTRYKDNSLESAQIFVSRDFFESKGINLDDYTYIKDGRTLLKKRFMDSELFNTIAARIPNQKHSSMLKARIVGFLPKGFKESVVVADEITAQMGSDYDIDHLYQYMYNYNLKYEKNIDDKYLSKDTKAFDKILSKRLNSKVYDKEIGELISLKNSSNLNIKAEKIKAAKKVGLYYNEENDKLYVKPVAKLEKVNYKKGADNNIAALENRYIDIHHSILSHPEIVKKTLESLDVSDAKEISDNIKSLKGTKEIDHTFSPLSNEFNNKEYKDNHAGKDGISIQSSVSMLLNRLEDLELPIKIHNNIFKFAINGDVVIFDRLGQGAYKYNGKDRSNLDNISIIQTESVDNAKNKLLNSLGYNATSAAPYNLFIFLAKSNKSLPLEMVAKIFKLDSVTKVFKNLENANDSYSKNRNKSKIIESHIKRYKTGNILPISIDLLNKSLKGELEPNVENSLNKTILSMMKEAIPLGENLLRIYSSANLETKGSGSTISEFLSKKEAISQYVLNNTKFDNVHKLLGDFRVENGKKVIEPNTDLGNIYRIGITEAEKFLSFKEKGKPLTLLGSYKYKKFLHNVLGGRKISSNKINRMESSFLSYAFSAAKNPILKIGDYFNLQQSRATLLKGDNNIYERIRKYLDNPNNKEGRTYLESISMIPKDNVKDAVVLKSLHEIKNSLEKELVEGSFNELAISNNSEARELANDLFRVILLNGLGYTKDNITSIKPTSFLLNNRDILNSYKEVNLEDIDIQRATRQAIQHSPEIADNYKEYSVKKTPQLTKGALVVLDKEYYKNGTEKEVPGYLNGDYEDVTRPYEFIGSSATSHYYRVLPKLGYKGNTFMEYDASQDYYSSLIESNNPNTYIEEYASKYGNAELKSILNNSTDLGILKNYVSTDIPAEERLKELYKITTKDKKNVVEIAKNFKHNIVLGKVLSELVDKSDLKQFDISNKINSRGLTTRGKFELNIGKFDNNIGSIEFEKEFEKVFSHEAIHSILYNRAVEYIKNTLVHKGLKGKFDKLNSLREDLLSKLKEQNIDEYNSFIEFKNGIKDKKEGEFNSEIKDRDKFYGLTDVHEFIAEMSNTSFLDFLKGIDIGKAKIEDILPEHMKGTYNALIDYYNIKDNEGAKQLVANSLGILYEAFNDFKRQELENPERYFKGHSGGASGADYEWGRIGKSFDINNFSHYYMDERSLKNAPHGNFKISDIDIEEGKKKVAMAAKEIWGYEYNTMKDPRLIRDWAQVKYGDAVYAVAPLVKKGEKLYPNIDKDKRTYIKSGSVKGGTGYAVEMAKQVGKDIYVFDDGKTNKWYRWDYDKNKFIQSDTPFLTKNFTGVGSRNITEAGKKAIAEVYANTLNRNIPEELLKRGTNKQETKLKEVESVKIGNITYLVKTSTGEVTFKSGKKVSDRITNAVKMKLFEDTKNPRLQIAKLGNKEYGKIITNDKVLYLSRNKTSFGNEIVSKDVIGKIEDKLKSSFKAIASKDEYKKETKIVIKKKRKDIPEIHKDLINFLGNYGFNVKDADNLLINLASKHINIDFSNSTHVAKAMSDTLGEMLSYSDMFFDLEKEFAKAKVFTHRVKEIETFINSKTRNAKRLAAKEIFKTLLEANFNKKIAEKLNISKGLLTKIKDFFNGLVLKLKGANSKLIKNKIAYIVDNTFKGDDFIRTTKKEGYKRVEFQEALDNSQIAKDIVTKIGTNNSIVLTGSLAYSTQGDVFRDAHNSLHDLDFINKSIPLNKLDSYVLDKFPNSKKAYSFKEQNNVDTYIIPPKGYKIDNVVRRKGGNKIVSYNIKDKNNKVVGTFKLDYKENKDKIYNEREIKNGIKATFVDFFSNSKEELYKKHAFKDSFGNTRNINISDFVKPFKAKLVYSRFKDIWDYNRFKTNDFIPTSLNDFNIVENSSFLKERKENDVLNDYELDANVASKLNIDVDSYKRLREKGIVDTEGTLKGYPFYQQAQESLDNAKKTVSDVDLDIKREWLFTDNGFRIVDVNEYNDLIGNFKDKDVESTLKKIAEDKDNVLPKSIREAAKNYLKTSLIKDIEHNISTFEEYSKKVKEFEEDPQQLVSFITEKGLHIPRTSKVATYLHEIGHPIINKLLKTDSNVKKVIEDYMNLIKKNSPEIHKNYKYFFSTPEEFMTELLSGGSLYNTLNGNIGLKYDNISMFKELESDFKNSLSYDSSEATKNLFKLLEDNIIINKESTFNRNLRDYELTNGDIVNIDTIDKFLVGMGYNVGERTLYINDMKKENPEYTKENLFDEAQTLC